MVFLVFSVIMPVLDDVILDVMGEVNLNDGKVLFYAMQDCSGFVDTSISVYSNVVWYPYESYTRRCVLDN